MKYLSAILIALIAAATPTTARAATVYYLITGQATANTTIDYAGLEQTGGHEMEWSAPSLSPTCLVTTCTVWPTTAFDSTFDWLLGGGNFTIKSNSPTADITLQLWEGNVGGTLAAPTGNLVASATVLATSVTGSYTATNFFFETPVTIQALHHYVATLTSTTGDNGNNQYDIKGINSLTIADSTTGGGTVLTDPGAAPEPSTWGMMVVGVALTLGNFLKRNRRRS